VCSPEDQLELTGDYPGRVLLPVDERGVGLMRGSRHHRRDDTYEDRRTNHEQAASHLFEPTSSSAKHPARHSDNFGPAGDDS
jgi:hypothetical protein